MDHIFAYLALEQANTWDAWHAAMLSQYRDLFGMQKAYTRRDLNMIGANAAAMASMNAAALNLHQYALGQRVREEAQRYGVYL